MRRTVLIGITAVLLGASVAYAATLKPRTPSLAQSVHRTLDIRRERAAIDMQILRDGTPHVIHVRSEVAPGKTLVDLRLGDQKLGKLVIPGPESAALIDGPFLYERAPSGYVVLGTIHWLRVSLASLAAHPGAVQAVQALTAAPLLRMLGAATTHALDVKASVFRGTIPYDDPRVDAALYPITDGLQFRNLRVTVWIGPEGLVRRVKLTGATPDGRTTLLVLVRLYGFGRPVHVSPPGEGAFLDQSLVQLSE